GQTRGHVDGAAGGQRQIDPARGDAAHLAQLRQLGKQLLDRQALEDDGRGQRGPLAERDRAVDEEALEEVAAQMNRVPAGTISSWPPRGPSRGRRPPGGWPWPAGRGAWGAPPMAIPPETGPATSTGSVATCGTARSGKRSAVSLRSSVPSQPTWPPPKRLP